MHLRGADPRALPRNVWDRDEVYCALRRLAYSAWRAASQSFARHDESLDKNSGRRKLTSHYDSFRSASHHAARRPMRAAAPECVRDSTTVRSVSGLSPPGRNPFKGSDLARFLRISQKPPWFATAAFFTFGVSRRHVWVLCIAESIHELARRLGEVCLRSGAHVALTVQTSKLPLGTRHTGCLSAGDLCPAGAVNLRFATPKQ